MASIPTGANAYIQYGWETTYGSASSNIDKQFGVGTKITSISRRNNLARVLGLGSRDAQKLLEQKYEGSLEVEFLLASSYFFKGVLGDVTDGGTGPYTHTYTCSNTIPSITTEIGIDMDTNSVFKLLGGKMKTATITFNAGEPVNVKLSIPYANETMGTTLSSSIATEVEEPFTFAQASFEFPDGTVIDDIQNLTLTIENSSDLIIGLGSRFASKAIDLERKATITLNVPFEKASDFLTALYGNSTGPSNSVAEIASAQITLSNNLTGTSLRKIEFNLADLKIDTIDMGISPAEMIKHDITIEARTITSIVATDNTPTCK